MRTNWDTAAVERAAIALYEFDEDLTEMNAKTEGIALSEPRLSWTDLCMSDPDVADAYRARATAALRAAYEPERRLN